MEKHTLPDFIVIDDDRTNNMICKLIIQNVAPGAVVKTFSNPEEGIAHIKENYAHAGANHIVLFLDINMPVLNGWEVLDEFENSPLPIKPLLTIFMLSSSVSPDDKLKAANNPLASGYIEKPLSKARLLEMFPGIVKEQ